MEPILITGAARSGTSLVAGIINSCGVWVGETSGPNAHNPKGMFENANVREHLVKPYLNFLGVDPMGQSPLPEIEGLKDYPGDLKKDVMDIFKRQGYKKGPFMYKGAKMCLVWPIWHDAFPKAKWIIVRRDAEDIALSCLATPFMRKLSNNVPAWLRWVGEHVKRFEEMKEAGLDVTEIQAEEIIGGEFKDLQKFVEGAGLKWNEREVSDFVDPSLWKRRHPRKTKTIVEEGEANGQSVDAGSEEHTGDESGE